MKKSILLSLICFFAVVENSYAAHVFGDRNGRVSVESSYGGKGVKLSFSTIRKSTQYHSYADYGRLGAGRGRRVSLPVSGPIHSYADSGNDRIVTIPYTKSRPIQGNFGKAYSRGYRF